MAGRFGLVKLGPPIEVFALNKAYIEDDNPNKVNLGVGGKFILVINMRIVLFAINYLLCQYKNCIFVYVVHVEN